MSGPAAMEKTKEGSRATVRDIDTDELIVRMLSFRGLGHVRVVIEAELERSGLTLLYEEAVAWHDALAEVIAEIDDWRATPRPLKPASNEEEER